MKCKADLQKYFLTDSRICHQRFLETIFGDNIYIAFVDLKSFYKVVIAQWLAWQLATGEVPGSNRGKDENLLIADKKGNLIIQI